MKNAKLSDQWRTPDWLFKELDEKFHFDIDLCATKENTKCTDFCADFLEDEWGFIENGRYVNHGDWASSHDCGFMNPPYSNPKPFIEKAWDDSKHCKIVCVVKCDPSTRWWATFWDYVKWENVHVASKPYFNNPGPKPGCEVRFFPKRIKFDPPVGQNCCDCNDTHGSGFYIGSIRSCRSCKKPLLSGPTFSSALLIFDRRGL